VHSGLSGSVVIMKLSRVQRDYRLADRRTAEMLAVARALRLEIVRSDGERV